MIMDILIHAMIKYSLPDDAPVIQITFPLKYSGFKRLEITVKSPSALKNTKSLYAM